MDFKNKDFFENFPKFVLFCAVVILLYITVIGALIVSIVNDKTYTEKRIYIKKIMQDIIDINIIVMCVLIGVLIVVSAYIINKNRSGIILNALADNKFILSILFVLIVVIIAMIFFCKYIQDIKETDLYNHGLGMIIGSIFAIIVIAIVVFIWHRKNTSRTIAAVAA